MAARAAAPAKSAASSASCLKVAMITAATNAAVSPAA